MARDFYAPLNDPTTAPLLVDPSGTRVLVLDTDGNLHRVPIANIPRTPPPSGTTLPANPQLGDAFILTQNENAAEEGLYMCVTPGVWTQVRGQGDPRGAGNGLTLDGNNLEVNPGEGIGIENDKVYVKLNGSTLARDTNGIKLSDTYKNKVDGIETGAEVNVNADWDATSGDAEILNKPTIPAAQVQSDWDETDTDDKSFINNKPTIPTVPARAGAFTAAAETKLNGIETGAEVNPKHTIPALRAEDGSSDNVAGVIELIDSDNNQVQSGSSTQIAAIGIPAQLNSMTQDPQIDTGTSTDHHSYLTDKAENRGSLIITIARINYDSQNAITGVSTTEVMVIQCEKVIANEDGSYALQELKHLKGIALQGSGYSWQLAAGDTNPIGRDALIGQWQQNQIQNYEEWIKRAELAGHETDVYASYNNAFVANAYKSGDWVLSTDTAGPPTTANQIGQPDIVTGSGVVAFAAKLRGDADPDHLEWNTPNVATDYTTGQIIYASLPRDKGSHLKITLTSNGTLVGTDDSAYIWATADWTEVGNIANVQDAGDYFTLSQYEPSTLRVRLPVQDIIGAVNVDGSNVSDALKAEIQGKNEAKTLTESFRVDVTNVERYVQISLAGALSTQNTMQIRIPSANAGEEIDNDLKRLLLPHAWVKIGGYTVDITTNVTRSQVGTSITYAFNFVPLTGTQPTGSTPVSVRVVGEDVHRGEIHRFAFENENWLQVITEIGTLADDDAVLIWDKSANTVRRVDVSDLRGDPLPDRTGNAGKFLTTDGTDDEWADVTLLNSYDSGATTDNTQRTVSDTDAIQGPSLSQGGIIETEDIANFGRVYKTAALVSLKITYTLNATLGVAFQVRYSTTKPTGSSDAKSYGTQCSQGNANAETKCLEFNTAANTYWWFALSGGGSRNVNKRNIQLEATYFDTATGTVSGVTAGDGLTGGGQSGNVSLAVNPGDGIEVDADKVRVKLDGSTLARGSGGLSVANPFTDEDETKLDGIETGAEVNVQSDWDASSGDAQILNKPTIPTVPDKASNADVDAETDDSDYTTVAKVFRAIGRKVKDASTTVKGILEIATDSEVDTGTDTERAVTPAGVRRATGAEVSSSEKTAGTETSVRRFSPKDVHDMIDTHGGDITAVTAGDGLTGGGQSGDVSLAVNPGDGIEVDADKVRVKLDGSTLARGSGGLSVANPFTDEDETKLDGIETGAEVNVQSDWDASSGDAQILNKPTIPTVPDKASNADVDAETDDSDYTTVAKVFRAIGRKVKDASTTVKGILEIATDSEVDTGTDTERAVTPAGVRRATGAEVSSSEKTAGTETSVRRFSPKDVHDMIDTHAPSGGGDGDITAVTAGDGLTGGGQSGDVTLNMQRAVINRQAADGNYTVLAADDGKMITVNTSTAAKTVNLPDTTKNGFEVTIVRYGNNTVTIDGDSNDTVDGASTYVLNTDKEAVRLRYNGGNWVIQAQGNVATFSGNYNDLTNKPTIPTLPTDAQIGEKAFDNVPADLTTTEKNTIKSRLGVAASDGDITAVTAGDGLTGGGQSGDVTLNMQRAVINRQAADGNYTVLAADDGKMITVNASTAAKTVNLPDTSKNGFDITIVRYGSHTVTIDGDSNDTVDGASTYVLNNDKEAIRLRYNNGNWVIQGEGNKSAARNLDNVITLTDTEKIALYPKIGVTFYPTNTSTAHSLPDNADQVGGMAHIPSLDEIWAFDFTDDLIYRINATTLASKGTYTTQG